MKKTKDNGPNLGGKIIINDAFKNFNDLDVYLTQNKIGKILIFISVYCTKCIDLLPHIKEVENISKSQIIIFSTGDIEDHKEMNTYFEWENINVVSLTNREMEEVFNVQTLPFCIALDAENVIYNKGVITNHKDILLTSKEI